MTAALLGLMATAALAAGPVDCSGKPPRNSPCMPSADERVLLNAQVEKAVAFKEAWQVARSREESLRRRSLVGGKYSYEEWIEAHKLLKRSESSMRGSFAAVLKATQDAYGVGPSKKVGTVHGGLLKGETAVWSPMIQEAENLVYKVDRPGKKPVYLSYSEDPDKLGQTLNDGGVFVSFKVLEDCVKYGSPARLAEVIAHEAVHFEAMTSKKGISGHSSAEASAYARGIEVGQMIGLDVERSASLARLHAQYYNNSLDLESGGWVGVPYRARPDSPDYPYQLRSDSFSEDWHRQNARLAAIRYQREGLVRRHEGSDQAAVDQSGATNDYCGYPGMNVSGFEIPAIPCGRTIATPSPGSLPARRAVLPPTVTAPVTPVPPSPPVFDVWGALKKLAKQGCSRPGTVTQGQLDELWPNIFGMVYHRNAGAALGLTGCEAKLLDRLVQWAAEYKPGRFELEAFEYEVRTARGQVESGEPLEPRPRERDYPMPGPEPCLDGAATCVPVTPPKR